MASQQGFSLIETLISLLLIMSTTVVLLRQQWQISQLLNQIMLSSQALVQFDNDNERQAS